MDKIHQVGDDVTACRVGRVGPPSTAVTEPTEVDVVNSVNTVVFIAKMVPVRIADLSPKDAEAAIRSIRSAREKDIKGGDGDGDSVPVNVYDHTSENINNTEVFLALGRVFSGTLTANSTESVYCLGNHHDPFEYVEDEATSGSGGDTEGEGDRGSGGDGGAAKSGSSAQRVPLSALSFYMCLGPSGQCGSIK